MESVCLLSESNINAAAGIITAGADERGDSQYTLPEAGGPEGDPGTEDQGSGTAKSPTMLHKFCFSL